MNEETEFEHETIIWSEISWWLMLITAVIAIPSLGFIVVTIAGVTGIIAICDFMVCCWMATYFGIHIVNHPIMQKKRDFTRE